MSAFPGIGHNRPPDEDITDVLDPTGLIDPDIIAPLLERNFQDLIERKAELLAGIERWRIEHGSPPVIKDNDDLRRTLDFHRQVQEFCRATTGTVEAEKKRVKGPVLAAASLIEGWFASIRDPVAQGNEAIHAAYTAHLVARESEERERRQAEAKRLRDEADSLAVEAEQASGPLMQQVLTQAAGEAARAADDALVGVQAGATELTRIRGHLGTTGGLRTSWAWEAYDMMTLLKAIVSGKESIDLIQPNDTVINALVRPKSGRRFIPGVRIFEKKTAR